MDHGSRISLHRRKMKYLDRIDVRGGQHKRIELYQGDLTSLSAAEGFDLLVVSAFPGDYFPTSSSLIGALYRKGLSVEKLANNKDVDLRSSFSCWLSREVTPRDPGLRFRRILCFEPLVRGRPPEFVGDIFRALTPIIVERADIKTLGLPVVAAGDQGYSVTEILSPLLEAAIHWLEVGLPLDIIKIVSYSNSQAQEAARVFAENKQKYARSEPPVRTGETDYDVFISYSRLNVGECEALERSLLYLEPRLRIFVDKKEINIGSPWQAEIFENIDKCKKVATMLSPQYIESKVCKEEFNIAWVRGRDLDYDLIYPIYIYSAKLPTYMSYKNYFDCREGNKEQIVEASKRLQTDLNRL
jgi:TIR domain